MNEIYGNSKYRIFSINQSVVYFHKDHEINQWKEAREREVLDQRSSI